MCSAAPIKVSGLNHAFGKGDLRKQILFDITTEIPEGEIVIVTGPSGSGKTTLLTLVGVADRGYRLSLTRSEGRLKLTRCFSASAEARTAEPHRGGSTPAR